jgi:hypothetical protein
VAFAAKTIFEMTTGAAVFVHGDAFTVVPVAHMAGALAGVIVGVVRVAKGNGFTRRRGEAEKGGLCRLDAGECRLVAGQCRLIAG